jgi:ComF family protein
MPRRTGGFCPRCGRLNDVAHEPPTPCGACLRDPGPWENIYFHGPYQGRLRRLILAYKFENALGLDSLLGGLLSGACLDSPCWRPPDLVVPVPLHPARLRWRGFNQSLELARPLARKAGVRIDSRALVRTRKTKPQTQVRDYRERAANLRQAFAAGPGLDGASVLLVDDVTTTGATLLECARALRDAGAARVDAAVLART